MGEFKKLGGFVDQSRFKKRPRYSLVLHDVRGAANAVTMTAAAYLAMILKTRPSAEVM